MELPSIGRIVHYVAHGSPVRDDGTQAYPSACRAALVTGIHNTLVPGESGPRLALAVVNPTGIVFAIGVRHDEQHEGGTWHWPGRTKRQDDEPAGVSKAGDLPTPDMPHLAPGGIVRRPGPLTGS